MSERKHRVVVADKISAFGLAPLLKDQRFEVELAGEWRGEDPDRFKEVLSEADGLIVRSATKVDRSFLKGTPKLTVVGRAGVGVDNIDMEAATEQGVAVLNAPAGNTVSAAELTMALMLSIARRIPGADRSVRMGEWRRSDFAGTELRGKTLGVVGAGRIGVEVARRARAFGMKVVATDPYLTADRAKELALVRVQLDELLATADVVSLHVPLTDETVGLISAPQLARMKPTAFLINVARGGVLDESSLAEALRLGELAGAALDVFQDEPLKENSELRDVPNLVLTPHLGASTAEAQELVAREIATAMRSALAEGDLSKALNAPAIGGEALRRLRPLFELGKRLGRLASCLTDGGVESVEIRYAGERSDALEALSSYVLTGLLGAFLGDDQVNVVNATHRAEVRRLGVSSRQLARRTDYSEFAEVIVRAESGSLRLAGALFGDQQPRIVRVDEYHVDVVPRGSLLILKNQDVPGVIGKVGTLLGALGLNIAEYHQARSPTGGDALAAVAIDGHVDRSLAQNLSDLPEISEAWVADLS